MKYSSFTKQQKLFESWRGYVDEAIVDVDEAIVDVDEAIVDVVAERLPDVFEDDGKMKAEVVNIVKDAIKKLKTWLAAALPNLKISEVAVVGAAVTYQYGPGSDIDVSVVIPGMPGDKWKMVDDWMEKNLVYENFKGEDGSNRPYQFKPMADNKGWTHVDAAYDPFKMDWIKTPDVEKAKSMYGQKMTAGSREMEAYKKVEKNLQGHFKKLYEVITSTSDLEAIYQAAMAAYKRKGAIKAMRGRSYGQDVEQGYISQNWGFGNIIYKMLDREGYTPVFDILKKIKKNKQRAGEKYILNQLKAALEKVINDELGYQGPKDY